MNFLPKLSPPMWVVSTSLFSAIIASNARLDPAVSIVLNPNPPLLLHFQSSAHMDAQPPDMPVRVVNHQDVNRRILAALIVASSLLATILFFLICFWIYRHKKSKNSDKKSIANSDVGGGLQLGPAISKLNYAAASARKGSVTVFEYRLLESATNNFHESNLLGKGDCGHVYKARFDEKFLAVVKRLDESDEDAERHFEIEVNWLSKIHHQNIISLLGYCVNGEARFLVYETMQNGSLESQLHGPLRGSALPWQLRMKIAVDVARGLEFLHERCNPPVVHRNLKSSHILLDSNFNAKLSDFGLAITLGAQNKNSLKPSGTLSCLAPEYFLDGKLTDKSDVYAFGVILLELLIGKNPAEKISTGQTQSSLVKWAMPQLTDRSKLPGLVDPVVKDTMDLKHLYQVAAVAVLCIQPEPSYRPLITDVLHSLIPLLPLELGGSLRMSEPANLSLP